jgi:hypothetical protein
MKELNEIVILLRSNLMTNQLMTNALKKTKGCEDFRTLRLDRGSVEI